MRTNAFDFWTPLTHKSPTVQRHRSAKRLSVGYDTFPHITVTAEDASKLLKQYNVYEGQRSLVKTNSAALAYEMRAGTFRPGTVMIFFDDLRGSRVLIDSQSRLTAQVSIELSTTYDIQVYFPVNNANPVRALKRLFLTIDSGSKRTMLHHAKAVQLKVRPPWMLRPLTSGMKLLMSSFMTTNLRLRQRDRSGICVASLVYAGTAELYATYLTDMGMLPRSSLTKPSIAAVALVTLRFSAARASQFWRGVSRGLDVPKSDPRVAYRDYLLAKVELDPTRRMPQMAPMKEAAVAAYCWNQFLAKQPIDHGIVPVTDIINDKRVIIKGTPYAQYGFTEFPPCVPLELFNQLKQDGKTRNAPDYVEGQSRRATRGTSKKAKKPKAPKQKKRGRTPRRKGKS